jgi:hypothetical protein
MHAVHPHLPHPVFVTLLAALAAIVVSLVLAARLGDVALRAAQTDATTGAAGARASQVATAARAPAWLNPFAPVVSGPIEAPWAPGA